MHLSRYGAAYSEAVRDEGYAPVNIRCRILAKVVEEQPVHQFPHISCTRHPCKITIMKPQRRISISCVWL
jgi:hypothetical protein